VLDGEGGQRCSRTTEENSEDFRFEISDLRTGKAKTSGKPKDKNQGKRPRQKTKAKKLNAKQKGHRKPRCPFVVIGRKSSRGGEISYLFEKVRS
jgi:hypothetical protein